MTGDAQKELALLLKEKFLKDEASASNARTPQAWEYSNHPLYIHHSHQPGMILMSQSLIEDNYNQWSQSMKEALKIKNKSGLINGSSPKPADDADEQLQWERCDTLVKTWLVAAMSKPIANSVSNCKTARAVLVELEERFRQKNTVQLFNIENSIHDCVQGNGTVTTFFTALKGLWDERDALCDLTGCECVEGTKISEYVKNQMTIKFLMGLNDDYASLRSTIVAIEPLPSVNKAYSMVLRHEKQAAAAAGGKSQMVVEGAAYAVRNGGSIVKEKAGETKCAKCHKTNHATKDCKAHLKCTFCNWNGHTYDECRNRKAAEEKAQKNSKANSVAASSSLENGADFPLSKEVCQQLIALLQQNRTT